MSNLNREVWEGWTVSDFIDSLKVQLDIIMSGQSWQRPFKTKTELAQWCVENQPYYKKRILAVINYFAKKYSLN